jgi:hypothetical protein
MDRDVIFDVDVVLLDLAAAKEPQLAGDHATTLAVIRKKAEAPGAHGA